MSIKQLLIVIVVSGIAAPILLGLVAESWRVGYATAFIEVALLGLMALIALTAPV